jgi:hypothetical protein
LCGFVSQKKDLIHETDPKADHSSLKTSTVFVIFSKEKCLVFERKYIFLEAVVLTTIISSIEGRIQDRLLQSEVFQTFCNAIVSKVINKFIG